jgi:hypothetical protein
MNNTELTSISEDELFFDIYQNSSLINNKKMLQETQTSKNSVSYLSIVDSIDYLGCINGNCSKIECNCKPNEKCDCASSKLCQQNSTVNGGQVNGGQVNSGAANTDATSAAISTSANSFVSKLIDFLFIVILLILIVLIVYNRAPNYLIYCLGILLIYIFYKMYNIKSV